MHQSLESRSDDKATRVFCLWLRLVLLLLHCHYEFVSILADMTTRKFEQPNL